MVLNMLNADAKLHLVSLSVIVSCSLSHLNLSLTFRFGVSMDSFSQYNFQHQKRGYALIICNENFKNKELTKRKGQLADLKAFKDTLEQHFKFDVDLKVDQTASQTQTLMEAGKSSPPPSPLPSGLLDYYLETSNLA